MRTPRMYGVCPHCLVVEILTRFVKTPIKHSHINCIGIESVYELELFEHIEDTRRFLRKQIHGIRRERKLAQFERATQLQV